MKKTFLLIATAFSALALNAQVVSETVSVGAGYANQVWYSLPDDEQGSAPKGNWDLAFDVSSYGVTIFTNSITGTTLWNYENGAIADWATVDTAGLSTWEPRNNSDTSWAGGAFNNYADPNNAYDVDWGIYNPTTHVVTGDSIYIIKLANGNYKKLIIENVAAGAYNFKYANLDGSSEQTASLVKADYTGKNFGYYSLQNNAALDREPASADWDLLFTQYTTMFPGVGPYTVSGVLSNAGVEVAQAEPVDQSTYVDHSGETFLTAINTIGYDWKTYSGSYVLSDTTVYFVKRTNGDIWKIVFTDFGGSANGNFEFDKELLTSTGIEVAESNNATAALYPNPSNGTNTTLIYSIDKPVSTVALSVYDLSGKLINAQNLNSGAGLHQHIIPAQNYAAGMYIVNLDIDGNRIQQKLIVR